ncbi:mediator complex subunit Med5-domain-containing protein [Trametes gibbosa]|nr:mediator complex subunit Med5-domain-containing protein [Trametes gibbosa]
MSLIELTRNAFQSGTTPRRWLELCKLFISKNLTHHGSQSPETEISNSVIVLFRHYPGDPTLQAYLRQAIQDGVLSLPTFLTTFLAAALSPNLRDASTLDMLCRVVLEQHYASGMPTIGSLVPYGEPVSRLLNTIQNSMSLLHTAHELPAGHFHQMQLTTSASMLLVLLIACLGDPAQLNISTPQALMHFAQANDLLQNPRLDHDVRPVLESFAISLHLLAGDDARVAREAQIMHLNAGKGDSAILSSSSEADIVTCSLVLNHLIFNRASDFGSGDGPRAVAILAALLRWSSWTPVTFYSQLLISALTCLAQSLSSTGPSRASSIWRAFTIGRLPHLLAQFQKSARPEGITETEWHSALQFALPAVFNHTNLLERIDNVGPAGGSDTASEKSVVAHNFTSEFLYQLLHVGLVEQAVVAIINPNLPNDFHSRVVSEAQDAGLDLPASDLMVLTRPRVLTVQQGYFETKLSPEASPEDIEVLLYRAWRDPCCHAAFAEVVEKRFTSSTKNVDTETLSLVCKMLCQHEMALDMLSLHAKISDLVAHALAFVEDYDCETVGDPQTAVTHLGDVVLFVEATIARFNLSACSFTVGERQLDPGFLRRAGLSHRFDELKGEDLSAFNSWTKALFDPNSEGIEDTILRATRPKVLLKIAPALFSHAITQCVERKMDKEVLSNGISYFVGPLLNWTLAGVIKFLLSEIQQRGYAAPGHLEVLKTLLTSPSCPPAVLSLSAPYTLRIFPDPLAEHIQAALGSFDPKPIRKAAWRALGLPEEGQYITADHSTGLVLPTSNAHWSNQARQLVTNALSAARGGRAVALDVDHCLLLAPPTKFLATLFAELSLTATMDMDVPRRVATFVLTMPRTPRTPPLLPIFFHLVLPSLVAAADQMSATEQAMQVEFLVSVVSSALTSALHLERAMLVGCGEERLVLGQSVTALARRLAGDLRRRGDGPSAGMVLQRLAAIQPFVSNFPAFAAEL